MKKAMESLRAKISPKAKLAESPLAKEKVVDASLPKVVETPATKALNSPLTQAKVLKSPITNTKAFETPGTNANVTLTHNQPQSLGTETPTEPGSIWERGREAALQLAYMLFMYILPHVINGIMHFVGQIVQRRAELPSLVSQLFTKHSEETRIVHDSAVEEVGYLSENVAGQNVMEGRSVVEGGGEEGLMEEGDEHQSELLAEEQVEGVVLPENANEEETEEEVDQLETGSALLAEEKEEEDVLLEEDEEIIVVEECTETGEEEDLGESAPEFDVPEEEKEEEETVEEDEKEDEEEKEDEKEDESESESESESDSSDDSD